jgi:peroxiredoxin/protocatechuate 3,4-dioxygenase beta subunit
MNATSILSSSKFHLPDAPMTMMVVARWTVFLLLAWVIHANSTASDQQETSEKTKKPDPVRRQSGAHERKLATVTIAGRAVDREGSPVANAMIHVVDDNPVFSSDRVLGTTTSGADGRYVFREISIPVLTPPLSAIPKPVESRIQVAGWVDGKAFTWHRTQSHRPEPRPAEANATETGRVFYAGEPITADLVFGPPARLSGTIVDDTGKPVKGALVQVGYVNDVRRPEGSGMWYCVAIDPKKGEDLPYGGIADLAVSRRTAHTDANGKYVIDGLPREAKLLALIDFKPSCTAHSLTIATSTERFEGVLSVGHEGILNHTFVVPRTVRVRATLAATGMPAAGVTITARGTKIQRSGSIGRTDALGLLNLELQPDSYTLRIEPPTVMDAVVSEQPLSVPNEPKESSINVKIGAGSVVMFESVLEGTGDAIAGVAFAFETDTTRVRKPIHSQTVFVDHPVTGSDGRLRVVMTPGTRRFFPRPIHGFEPVHTDNPLITLAPGTTTDVKFAFRKVEVARSPDRGPSNDDVIQRLNGRLQIQRDLIRRGRVRATRYYQSGEGISPDQVVKLLDSLDPDRVAPVLDLIHKQFPTAEPAAMLRVDVTVDEPRRREEWAAPHRQVSVFNGQESIRFMADNAQADIADKSAKCTIGIPVEGIERFVDLAFFGGTVSERVNGKVTLERNTTINSARRVVDLATGFVYRDSMRYKNGSSASEFWQFAPRPTPEGLVIPGMSVELLCVDNRTNAIFVRVIESIDLKPPIGPESFVVAVPPGTMILDYREGPDDTDRGVMLGPVTDALARADEIAATRKRFVPPVKAGDPAPAIDASVWLNHAGKTDEPMLEGKVILVDFWGTTCGPCVGQLPEVLEAARHFAGTDLLIVGLHDSSGTVKEVAEFAAKRGLTYPLAIDRASKESGWFGATFAAYGVRGIPSAAVLDRQRRVVFVGEFRQAIEQAAKLLKTK